MISLALFFCIESRLVWKTGVVVGYQASWVTLLLVSTVKL